MEDSLLQLANSGGPIGIVAACLMYLIISIQRNNTSAKRDKEKEDHDKRIALLEDRMNRLKDLDLEARLAGIETSLRYIESLLKELKEKH